MSNKKLISVLLATLVLSILMKSGAPVSAENGVIPKEIFLWPNAALGSQDLKISQEVMDRSKDNHHPDRVITKIARPSLLPVFPAKIQPNNAAVLICPGGEYQGIEIDKEGYEVAKRFNSLGIATFILKYRLPGEDHNNTCYAPLQDAQRAMRIIRQNAVTWKIDPEKIGVIGISAGGHLAATLGTQYHAKVYNPVDETDAVDCKPNFMMLVDPLISMKEDDVNLPARNNLLGTHPQPELINQFSAELHVDSGVPPTWIVENPGRSYAQTRDIVLFFIALQKAAIQNVEMHLFREGTGSGNGTSREINDGWTQLGERWMAASGIIKGK